MTGAQLTRGFTLIEVLIAMTLLSIMMVLLFGSLKICAESWDKGEKKITEVSDVSAVITFFERHLTVARPLWNDFIPNQKVFSFQGKQQSLQFVSSFPASAGRAGLQLISVELQRNGSEQALKVTLRPFFPLPEGEEWREENEILVRHVKQFALAYFGPEDGLSENQWHDEWLEKDRQPEMVKIKIELDNAVFWPEMLIALKLAHSDNSDSTFNSNAPGDSEDENGDDSEQIDSEEIAEALD